MKLTKEDVKKFAELARIKLTDSEIEKFQGELSHILEFVGKLDELDLSDIKEVSHVDDFVGDVLAQDLPGNQMNHEKTFLNDNGKRRNGNYFETSKIL